MDWRHPGAVEATDLALVSSVAGQVGSVGGAAEGGDVEVPRITAWGGSGLAEVCALGFACPKGASSSAGEGVWWWCAAWRMARMGARGDGARGGEEAEWGEAEGAALGV